MWLYEELVAASDTQQAVEGCNGAVLLISSYRLTATDREGIVINGLSSSCCRGLSS